MNHTSICDVGAPAHSEGREPGQLGQTLKAQVSDVHAAVKVQRQQAADLAQLIDPQVCDTNAAINLQSCQLTHRQGYSGHGSVTDTHALC